MSSPLKANTLYNVRTMDDDASEHTPLLPREAGPAEPTSILRSSTAVVVILAVLVGIAGIADSLMIPPYTKILESIICYRYYEEQDPSKLNYPRSLVPPGALGGVDEALCKINPVQDDLARNQGYQGLFDGIPSLLLAIPLGWAADKLGRKPILILGFVSFLLEQGYMGIVMWFWQSFPSIDYIWLSSVPLFLGGGKTLPVAIVFTMVSDVVDSSGRANAFLRVGAANIIPYVVGQPLAGAMLALHAWTPFIVSTLLYIPMILLILLLPETIDWRPASNSRPPTPPSEPISTAGNPASLTTPVTFPLRHHLQNTLAFVLRDPRIPLLTLLFAGHTIYGNVPTLVLQYTAKRYAQPYSTATILDTIYYLTKAVIMLGVLPLLTPYLTRAGLSKTESQKDLFLSRASFFLLALGWALVGLAPGLPMLVVALPIAAAGTGPAYLVLRSFLTGLVPARHVARVYTSISVLDTLGAMGGGPLLAKLFSQGLHWEGVWVGLPFLALAGLGAFTLFVLCMMGHKEDEGKGIWGYEEDADVESEALLDEA